jgi:hypothetical protein
MRYPARADSFSDELYCWFRKILALHSERALMTEVPGVQTTGVKQRPQESYEHL